MPIRFYTLLVACLAPICAWAATETNLVQLTLVPDAADRNRLDVTLIHTGLGAGQDTDETAVFGTVWIALELDTTNPTSAVPDRMRVLEDDPGHVALTPLHWQWSFLGQVNVTSQNIKATARTQDDAPGVLTAVSETGEFAYVTDDHPIVLNDGAVYSDHWLNGNSEEANLTEDPLVAYTSNDIGVLYWSPGMRVGLSITHAVELHLPLDFDEQLGNANRLQAVGTIVATGTAEIVLSDFDGDLLADFEDPDDDNDQLPDGFEAQHASLNAFDAGDALLDIDLDGMNALSEYIAGTDLTNPLSFFALGWDGTAFGVETVTGRHYTLWCEGSIVTGGWSTVVRETDGSGGWISFTNLPLTAPSFFRLGARMKE